MIASAPTARDYVVSTTYRKEEQAGLKWSRLRGEPRLASGAATAAGPLEEDLPASGPRAKTTHALRFPALFPGPSTPAIGSISDTASGVLPAAGSPPEAVLATMLEHAALPLRWEPLNGASPHRGVPSGGSAFGVELFLIARDHDGLACFRHLPHDGALKREGSGPRLSDILGDAGLAVVIVGNLASYVDPYGEFSPCLAGLECGIIAAQLSLLCHAHGWASETVTRHDYGAVAGALQLGHWSRVPAIVMRLKGPGAGEAVRRCRTEILSTSETVTPGTAADVYPRMRCLIETIMDEPPPPLAAISVRPGKVPPPGTATGPTMDLLEVIRRRSSGLSADLNRPGGGIAAGAAAALAADIAALHTVQGETDLADVDLSVGMLASDHLGRPAVPFKLDPRNGRLPDPVEPARGWGRFELTIGVDDVAEERRSGARAFILNHLAAGALAQRICLAATAHGLFARPLRGYSELAANRHLGLEHRAILQIACGARRQANPDYDLRWW